MKPAIALLPRDTVHLIAAGEVIDSLAAVVRELAENALDAQATRIAIALWPEQGRVRVADNGVGMSLADLQQAAIAHSTSKIRDANDLWNIASLGFRGEALHSLAQLATLQIASRPAGVDPLRDSSLVEGAASPVQEQTTEGWLVTYDHQGQAVTTEPMAIAPGTIAIVDALFAKVPSRRQGLPPLTQQLRAVQTTIQHLALSHPQVTWHVQQHDRDWFAIFAGASPRQIVPQILRDVQVSDLQDVSLPLSVEYFTPCGSPCEQPPNSVPDEQRLVQPTAWPASPLLDAALQPSIYVVVGLPDRCHRHRPDWVRVAVNNRFVRLPELEQTILAGFRRTLPRDRHPLCLVYLRVPPHGVDWNRHPAKTEIYLHHLQVWREQVAIAIEQALRLNPGSVPEGVYSSRMSTLLKTAEAAGHYTASMAGANAAPLNNAALATDALTVANQQLTPLKAIAQVHQMYILAEHPSGIWLIEQHIAHERVLYEQVCDRWQLVPLEPPMILHQLTLAQVEQLERIGLEVEPFGEQTWVVRSAPALLAHRADCAEALVELSLGGNLQEAQAATACRSAIRNGAPLTPSEMQTLLNQWQQTRNPRTCPHGRPICLTLEESSLSRFFRRHWMIGKSHGI